MIKQSDDQPHWTTRHHSYRQYADPPRIASGGLESGSVLTSILVYLHIYKYIYTYIYVCVLNILFMLLFHMLSIYIYINTYMCIYILEFTVATLPNSSPPLALRGGSAYGLYEWSRGYYMQKNALLGAYLNYDPYLNFFDLHWPIMAYEVKMT